MKIGNSILSDILLKFDFKEVNKKNIHSDKRHFRKVGLHIVIDGPNVIYSDNVYDYHLCESNFLEELTSLIYYTQLIKKDRDIITNKLDLEFNELKNIYLYLKREIETHPQYSILSEHYVRITKLKNSIENLYSKWI